MNFRFVSEPTFEPWDHTNPNTVGIGGSETSHIEMSRRLCRRDHSVWSYAPIPGGAEVDDAGVFWIPSERYLDSTFGRGDVWIIYRAPHMVDQLPKDAIAWLICQDVDYPRQLTEERAKRFSRIIALCETHAAYLKARYPFVADRIFVSSNGIRSEFIAELSPGTLISPETRNSRRLMYASSPDRGMEFLLDIFPRAKEIVPDLELHIYYGFDNIDKLKNEAVRKNAERLKEMTHQPGVTVHGRTPQPKLTSEWFKAGIWCHPSNFTETSCITCMDAQACGAIPITQPVWAVGENVQHGIFIEGDVRSDLIRSRYVTEVVSLALDPERQQDIRSDMMPYARERFGWERFVDQWEAWARMDIADPMPQGAATRLSEGQPSAPGPRETREVTA